MLPNKIELQWLLPVSNENDIENVMSQLTERIMVIKNMEGSSI